MGPCGLGWGGSRDRAKRPQSSPTSRAARSLSSASLLMLPAARTPPPRTPPLGPTLDVGLLRPSSHSRAPGAGGAARQVQHPGACQRLARLRLQPPGALGFSAGAQLCRQLSFPSSAPRLNPPQRNVQMARGGLRRSIRFDHRSRNNRGDSCFDRRDACFLCSSRL